MPRLQNHGITGLWRLSLISLIGLIGLIGCSKESAEEPEPEQPLLEAICFSGGLQEDNEVVAGTRAETEYPLHEKVQSFKVWAFKNKGLIGSNYTNPQLVFPGYTVSWANNSANTTTTNSNGWEYVDGVEQTIKYWDMDAKAYRFFACAPSDPYTTVRYTIENTTNGNTTYESFDDYKVFIADHNQTSYATLGVTADASNEEEAPYLAHLWFSNNAQGSEHIFPSTVQMKFYKPFARVRFMFTFAEGVTLTRDDIEDQVFAPTDQHAGIAISGKVNITIPLTGTSTEEEWSTTPTGYMINSNGDNVYFTKDWYECSDANSPLYAGREYWYTVLPAKDQGSYTLTANISGSDQTAVVPAEFMQWSPGYSYTYIFKVMTGGGIKFDEVQVAIRQWELTPPTERKVYNW